MTEIDSWADGERDEWRAAQPGQIFDVMASDRRADTSPRGGRSAGAKIALS
jgi:hypothetical protein